MDYHTKILATLCRICTKKLGRVSYSSDTPAVKGGKSSLIQVCFETPEQPYNSTIHPPRFCNSCYLTMRRMKKAKEEGTVYRSSLSLHTWEEHSEEGCSTCRLVETRKVGGRPKNKSNVAGCSKHLTSHISSVSGPSYRCSAPLSSDRFVAEVMEECVCKLCNNIVDQPVELPCKHLLCRSCCLESLTTHIESFPCPSCQRTYQQTTSTFQSPSPVVNKLLAKLVVRCENKNCTKLTFLQDLRSHLESRCRLHHTNQHSITVDQILQQPVSTPPMQPELEAAGHTVRRILHHSKSKGQSFSLPTGGHVSAPLKHLHSK